MSIISQYGQIIVNTDDICKAILNHDQKMRLELKREKIGNFDESSEAEYKLGKTLRSKH